MKLTYLKNVMHFIEKVRNLVYNMIKRIYYGIGEIIISNKQRYARRKQWLLNRNKKALKARSKSKKFRKDKLSRIDNNRYEYHKRLTYDKKNNRCVFRAPLRFGFTINPEETNSFFSDLLKFIVDWRNHGKKIHIDISKISELTIDALMYLLAIINNLNSNIKYKYRFSGNVPENDDVRMVFENSGFYDYVYFPGKKNTKRNSDSVRIVSGKVCENTTAKHIADFLIEKACINMNQARFIYVMMIELMSNTFKHAYNTQKNSTILPRWYCNANYDSNDTICFTFMDTGEGIPSTVRKNFTERIDILKFKTEDKYVVSALNGDFRTSTKQFNRGKGLPKIREICSKGIIQNLKIFTNKAAVLVNKDDIESYVVKTPLQGTLYYWEVSISKLKGEVQ